uniref:Uncharacterized protein n=1 Tax=Zonotrichia albicollis TaxID=44394 RepID=A0A8D2MV97_ZONAL
SQSFLLLKFLSAQEEALQCVGKEGGLGPEQNFLRVAYLTCFFSIWKLPSECCLDLECFFPFSPKQCVNPNNLIISVHS